MTITNLFDDLPTDSAREQFLTLTQSGRVRIERIVSAGHTTEPGEWYDQPDHEWVMVLRGSARLRFESEPTERIMQAGDFVSNRIRSQAVVSWLVQRN